MIPKQEKDKSEAKTALFAGAKLLLGKETSDYSLKNQYTRFCTTLRWSRNRSKSRSLRWIIRCWIKEVSIEGRNRIISQRLNLVGLALSTNTV